MLFDIFFLFIEESEECERKQPKKGMYPQKIVSTTYM